MANQVTNILLSAVMQRIRQQRPRLPAETRFYNRVERSRGGNYVEVWFMTAGCEWDAQGGCTMCNYGQGHELSQVEMTDAVRQALAAITVEVSELVVSPSGSMLDTREVPPGARRHIFSLIREFPTPQFVFETRPETVTPEAIQEFVESVPGKRLGVEIGLESSSEWVQRFCVNKGSHPSRFAIAAEILHQYGLDVYANICLGTAFLTPAEAIQDTVRSARWAFANGADIVVVFPVHVKPYTLLAWLHGEGSYSPPSLWSLVEVLHRLGPSLTDRTEISWYRSYYEDDSKIINSPATCVRCQEDVMALLDEYRDSRSPSAVRKLRRLRCECKDTWRDTLRISTETPLAERVLRIYRRLADHFLQDDWWTLHGGAVKQKLLREYPEKPMDWRMV